jgi:UDPglucose 6-dehydrogenase
VAIKVHFSEKRRVAMKVSVVGLGKLGICIASCIASKGLDVVGVDIDRRVVASVNAGKPPLQEPGLGELMDRAGNFLRATEDVREAVLATDVTFIVVPTPSDSDGGFSLEYVLAAVRDIGRALADKNEFHVVCLTSTVLPGATDESVLPLLERLSGKRCGIDFGLAYTPEFIALGTVIRDFLNPDLILIGESDEATGSTVSQLYSTVCENGPPMARMPIINAELAKIAVNTYVTTKITFANTLAELCERLPGGDVDAVTGALGLDSRIGAKYLKGAIGYGGPCFPRDNRAFAYLADKLGVASKISSATDETNRRQVPRLVDTVRTELGETAAIGVLGMAYKPDTVVVEESQGLLLAKALAQAGYQVSVYDPLALEHARAELGETVAYAASLEDVVETSDGLIVVNADPAFSRLQEVLERTRRRDIVILDCWRMLPRDLSRREGVRYVPLGIGLERDASASTH